VKPPGSARRLRALVFDLDGLLVDSEPIWHRVRSAYATAHGVRWTDADRRAVLGGESLLWLSRLRERMGGQRELADIESEVEQLVAEAYPSQLRSMPGAQALLERMSGRIPLALATGSRRRMALLALRLSGFEQVFDVVCCADDVARGKPAPDLYELALQRLGVAPRHAVGVEDSSNGVRALSAAGMGVIAVPAAEGLEAPVRALVHAQLDHLSHIDLPLLEQVLERRDLGDPP
jgi:HAD superfamily hydrolase (TIGR01509 family)